MAGTYKPLFGSRAREQVWQLECLAAHRAGRGAYPICIHCDLPVTPGDAWDRAHIDVPRAFGGKSVGVGHRLCNQLDNNQVVTPAAAKARAVRNKHLGIAGPGLGKAPMRFGRRSRHTATMRHGVQPRLTQGEKHKAFMARRYGLGAGHDPLADLTDGLMQGDIAETAFAERATLAGAPIEQIHDLITLSRVSAEMGAP